MQNPELSLPGKLDSGLTKGLCLILGGLKIGALWLLGLVALASVPWVIFEYGDGLADISLLEWSFMALLALLSWRHLRYCKHFTLGFWRGLSRLLIAQGIIAAVWMVTWGTSLSLLTYFEHSDEVLRLLTQEDPLDKFLAFGMVLLALYLGPPTARPAPLTRAAAVHARVEPEVLTPAKEASL